VEWLWRFVKNLQKFDLNIFFKFCFFFSLIVGDGGDGGNGGAGGMYAAGGDGGEYQLNIDIFLKKSQRVVPFRYTQLIELQKYFSIRYRQSSL
jgi:hypothetical protein